MQRQWRGTAYWLAQDPTALGMAPPTVGFVLPYQSLIKKIASKPALTMCSVIQGRNVGSAMV